MQEALWQLARTGEVANPSAPCELRPTLETTIPVFFLLSSLPVIAMADFFFFKCLKERPDSLEATGLYLKETVWHLQGKGHFFTPLKRIDNNNRENIQQEELHFPRPPGETVTQL